MSTDKLIELYFSNQLSKEERLEFDTLYKNDETFRKEIGFLENVKTVSELEDSQNFKSQLDSFEKEHQTTNKPKSDKAWIKPLLAVAAIIIIALSFTFGWNRPIDESQLFDTYFEPSKNVTQPIVRSDADENMLNNAFMAYNGSNYQVAISLFENAYQASKQSELLFYEGNSFLALDKPKEAIEKFKEHLTFADVLTHRSHWYLALAYLKTKDSKNAKLQLKALLNSGENFKKEEASSILKKLE